MFICGAVDVQTFHDSEHILDLSSILAKKFEVSSSCLTFQTELKGHKLTLI